MTKSRNRIRIQDANRIVVKVGSTLLVDDDTGSLKTSWLNDLCQDIANWHRRGQEMVIVSSGAIALGRRYLGLTRGELRLEEKQASAAAGMVRLSQAYQEALGKCDMSVAQVLLTLDDSENRRRYLNARSTLITLLNLGVVPLINENDTIATDEIRFGDNDRLAARVSTMISSDLLILLSDIAGLHTADPLIDPNAALVPLVEEITPEILSMAGISVGSDSSGGMPTKLAAAKQCLGAGCHMIICNGSASSPLQTLESGGDCTWFKPSGTPQTARKQWIGGSLLPVGKIHIDSGALDALKQGRSLLPAGVTGIEGSYSRGDAVAIISENGEEIGRGLSAYSSSDAELIIGHKTNEIESLVGYRGRDEMIHRDDLVIF